MSVSAWGSADRGEPPLTLSTCPVMKDASSEAKNNTAAADEKGHARVPAAVVVYLTPMTGNLLESPGSQRSLETEFCCSTMKTSNNWSYHNPRSGNRLSGFGRRRRGIL